jgi:hypothetical protein
LDLRRLRITGKRKRRRIGRRGKEDDNDDNNEKKARYLFISDVNRYSV